jgi:hypothetical protein
MYWLKSCPRCSGDLVQTTELEDYRVSCLQCGLTLTREQETTLPRTAPAPRSMEDVSSQFWTRALAPRHRRPVMSGGRHGVDSVARDV